MTTPSLTAALFTIVCVVSFLAYFNDRQDAILDRERHMSTSSNDQRVEPSTTPGETNTPVADATHDGRSSSVLGAQDDSMWKTDTEIPIHAEAGIVVETTTGNTLYAKNHLEIRPIASLTKLMTGLVYLDMTNNNPPFERTTTIFPNEYTIGGTLQVYAGEELCIRDLFNVMLLGSANNATNALVRTIEPQQAAFVTAMNAKARELGLTNTTFVEPTGLSPENTSTLDDVAKLAIAAFHNDHIKTATSAPSYEFTFQNSQRAKSVKNTNELTRTHGDVRWRGSKTGYLDEAHYCLIVNIEMHGREYIVGVLASPSEETQYDDILRLIAAIEQEEFDPMAIETP